LLLLQYGAGAVQVQCSIPLSLKHRALLVPVPKNSAQVLAVAVRDLLKSAYIFFVLDLSTVHKKAQGIATQKGPGES
jgi:hypothetical protein